MKNKTIYGIIIAALFLIHALLGVSAIKALSPTYDEHIHLVAGYSYFKTTDYIMNGYGHPPLAEMWSAAPLLFMNPSFPTTHPFWADILAYQYPFADLFMYHNRVDAEKMLRAGRFMIMLMSLGLGFLIFRWSRELFGDIPAMTAVFLWSFSSLFIAHGTLVTTDMVITLFYFAFFYSLWKWWRAVKDGKPAPLGLKLFVGVNWGLLMVSKFSAVAVFPAAGLIILWILRREKTGLKRVLVDTFMAAAAAVLTMMIVYQFVPLSEYYVTGLKKMMSGILYGRSTFLMGKYSTTGWFYYFPAVFLLKTPLPFLALLLAAFFRKHILKKEIILFVLIPAFVYFGMSCFSKVQIGYRHIMPAFPFLTLFISGLFVDFNFRKPAAVILSSALLFWYSFGTFKTHPWHISYFNETIGNPDRGYLYLTDSNLDWGQGVKELAKYLRNRNVSGVYLCYFGASDPHYYGIKYFPIGFIDTISDGTSTPLARGLRPGDRIDFTKEPAALFVISATNLQATYYAQKDIFSFLKEIKPEKIIAHSIFVYNLSENPEQYRKLKEFLKKMGFDEK
ncbi:MAG: glycosyltransferase family 39 protein [Elusimicrobiota bacterium]